MARSMHDLFDEFCELVCGCKRNMVRIVPHLGVITEQSAQPVIKTLQYQGCARGDLLMKVSLTSTQQVRVTAKFTDKRGHEAAVQDPTWQTNNSDVLALTPDADGKGCLIAATGSLGTDIGVTLTADADLGDGVQHIIGTIDFDVTPGSATVVALNPEAVEEQPTL